MKFSILQMNALVLMCSCLAMAGCGAGSEGNFRQKLEIVGDAARPGVPSLSDDDDHLTLTSQNSPDAKEEPTKLRRRIVYDTNLELIVEKYEHFETSFLQIVDGHNGFVSKSETNRVFADRQSGVWVARIPVEDYPSFMIAVVDLGFAETRRENAKDITSEFVDIEARIRNNEELERRIITMLEERTGKLSDVIEIERELSRVREEVERMQGRLRVMSDQSSLATVTVRVREEQEYVPVQSPTFQTRLASTWGGSLGAVRKTGEVLLLFFVGAIPWLICAGLAAAVIGFPTRAWMRRRSEHRSLT